METTTAGYNVKYDSCSFLAGLVELYEPRDYYRCNKGVLCISHDENRTKGHSTQADIAD